MADISPLEVNLTAAIVGVQKSQPTILATIGSHSQEAQLPTGPYSPSSHHTLERGLRAWVNEQTGLKLGYVEQLYTFGDRGRLVGDAGATEGTPVISIGYLALVRSQGAAIPDLSGLAHGWYHYFPWEDWRAARPAMLDAVIIPALRRWIGDDAQRMMRGRLSFGLDGALWDEERVLERYELLYEAGLIFEAVRDAQGDTAGLRQLGAPMAYDHRRILATAMGRLRGKLKYRPVVFELLPDTFTLTALQDTVEALFGKRVHKQNFRRLVESTALVEPTGESTARTGGRPAALFRFRRDVLAERPAPGIKPVR